jgi:hypothetical protein
MRETVCTAAGGVLDRRANVSASRQRIELADPDARFE